MYTLELNNLFNIAPVATATYDKHAAFGRMCDFAGKENKWDTKKLIAKLDINKQIFNNWKTRGLPSDRLKQVSDVLGCAIEWLVDGESAPSGAPIQSKQYWPFPVQPDIYEKFNDEQKDAIDSAMLGYARKLEKRTITRRKKSEA